jgi:hypothetical protein
VEQSVWTWSDRSGRPHDLGRFPCLWRRVLDHSPQLAAEVYGPAVEPGESPRNWQELHRLLVGVAALWGPADAAGVQHFVAHRHPVPRHLNDLWLFTAILVRDGELGVSIENPWAGPVVVARSLRAFLASQALSDCRDAVRHHRCEHCNEWHPLFREGARFCSSVCRNEANRAAKQLEGTV